MTQALAARMRIDDPDWHLTDEVEDVYAELRRDSPMFWYEPAQCWLVMKYADIKHASANPGIYSSAGGIHIRANLQPERDAVQLAGAQSIIRVDPPRHHELRRLVSRAFTPRLVRTFEDSISRIADEALDDVDPGEVNDFVDKVAVPIPMYVIADLLGVPREDRHLFKVWSDAMVRLADVRDADELAEIGRSTEQMVSYFRDMLAQRRVEPRNDLVTGLAEAEVSGLTLSEDDIVMLARTILVAGNETTRNLISGGVVALAQHPDERRRLIDHPDLMANAVEELLRWTTPVRVMGRTVTEATELGGQQLKAGEYVILVYPSANRDEDVWERPTTLDVGRTFDSMHLAFGYGQHACLGASLARMEARILFTKLLDRFPDFEIPAPPERLSSVLINGVVSLPFRARP
jgi:cytochrome P450